MKMNYYKCDGGIIVNLYKYDYVDHKIKINDIGIDSDNFIVLKNERGGWVMIKGSDELTSYSRLNPSEKTLVAYKLINTDLASDKIPLGFTLDEVGYHLDEEDCVWVWSKHKELRSLYEEVYSVEPECYAECDYDFCCIGTIVGGIDDPVHAQYTVLKPKDAYGKHAPRELINIADLAHYSFVDALLTPEFAHHMKPCYLNEIDSYNIIRTYIMDNIDPRHAKIESNYSTGICVHKIVMNKPKAAYSEYDEIPRKKRPIFNDIFHNKTFEVFKISSEPRSGYNIVNKFEGENLADMVNNINTYLRELMDVINAPHYPCECCNGLGYTK